MVVNKSLKPQKSNNKLQALQGTFREYLKLRQLMKNLLQNWIKYSWTMMCFDHLSMAISCTYLDIIMMTTL